MMMLIELVNAESEFMPAISWNGTFFAPNKTTGTAGANMAQNSTFTHWGTAGVDAPFESNWNDTGTISYAISDYSRLYGVGIMVLEDALSDAKLVLVNTTNSSIYYNLTLTTVISFGSVNYPHSAVQTLINNTELTVVVSEDSAAKNSLFDLRIVNATNSSITIMPKQTSNTSVGAVNMILPVIVQTNDSFYVFFVGDHINNDTIMAMGYNSTTFKNILNYTYDNRNINLTPNAGGGLSGIIGKDFDAKMTYNQSHILIWSKNTTVRTADDSAADVNENAGYMVYDIKQNIMSDWKTITVVNNATTDYLLCPTKDNKFVAFYMNETRFTISGMLDIDGNYNPLRNFSSSKGGTQEITYDCFMEPIGTETVVALSRLDTRIRAASYDAGTGTWCKENWETGCWNTTAITSFGGMRVKWIQAPAGDGAMLLFEGTIGSQGKRFSGNYWNSTGLVNNYQAAVKNGPTSGSPDWTFMFEPNMTAASAGTADPCACPSSGDFEISSPNTCIITTACDIGANIVRVNNGAGLNINSGGQIRAGGFYCDNNALSCYIDNNGGLGINNMG